MLEHPDGQTVRSLFIDDRTVLCPAPILAEIGDSRDRYKSYRELAADAGQAPGAVESAGRTAPASAGRAITACAKRSTRSQTRVDTTSPWANDIYTRARQRGCTHQHETRILGRAWCQIIWRIWHDNDTY